ncbi:hypothetical protein D0B54_20390 [Solimonas sp. K1W22B-7]|nr:hypothetical protein D0B54_20390 [Solimonas sp. K1W22B-7]
MFKLKALLGKHSSREGGISTIMTSEDGDSFIVAGYEDTAGMLHTSVGKMILRHNAKKELALVEFDCNSTSIHEAKHLFLKALTPFLDHLSFLANIPLHIVRVGCLDTVHHIESVDYVGPHANVQLNPHASSMEEELIPVYALYREAKNNPSSLYKFLCYYKILEGIYKSLRPALMSRAKDKGISIAMHKEVVPKLHDPLPDHAELEERQIKEVFNGRFREDFRNQAAHFLLGEGLPLNVSDSEIYSKFSRELPLIEVCVRIAMETHREYLQDYQKKVASFHAQTVSSPSA